MLWSLRRLMHNHLSLKTMLEPFMITLDGTMGKRSFPVRVDANNWKAWAFWAFGTGLWALIGMFLVAHNGVSDLSLTTMYAHKKYFWTAMLYGLFVTLRGEAPLLVGNYWKRGNVLSPHRNNLRMWKFTIAHKTSNRGMTMDAIDVLHASLGIAYSKENHNWDPTT